MQQRPKPPPSYYKILIPSEQRHHPLRRCPYCKSNAPFVFEDDALGFQDKKAQMTYERFLRDDLEWYNLSLVILGCGLTPVEFERIHGPRPHCDSQVYMVAGVLLTQHWSRYLAGQCGQCGTKIWRDLGVPPHYYYQPPQPSQLPLPSMGDTKAPLVPKVKRGTNNGISFQDIFSLSSKSEHRKEW